MDQLCLEDIYSQTPVIEQLSGGEISASKAIHTMAAANKVHCLITIA